MKRSTQSTYRMTAIGGGAVALIVILGMITGGPTVRLTLAFIATAAVSGFVVVRAKMIHDRVAPGRVVALGLIVALIGSLAMTSAAGTDKMTVPRGAKAGEVSLRRCTYSTRDGKYTADCGRLVVPENRSNPQSRLIALPIKRIRARSAQPAAPIFRLEGGPGVTNMDFPWAGRFASDHDVVLVGYRGVDGSSVLDCPEVESALKHANDYISGASFRRYAEGFRSCAARLTDDGVDLAGYSLTQRVDDLEAARRALGYDKIDLVSESAGTRTAMIYAWRYPASIHRSVMIGVNPPGHYFWDGKVTDAQLARYADYCAKAASCAKRTAGLTDSMRRAGADIPDRWWLLPIKDGNVRIVSFFASFETSDKMAPANGPLVLDTWLRADKGDPSGFWFASVFADLFLPEFFVWGEWAAIGTQDAWAAKDYYAGGGDPGTILRNAGSEFNWAGGLLTDVWPTSPDDAEYRQVRTSAIETLLIGGELDISTPPEIAKNELLPFLPNGHQVVLPATGHSGTFWNDQPAAGTRLISAFLATGAVDDSLYTPAIIDFTPSFPHARIAKIVAGSMAFLALLTIVSLAWMAYHVRKRGRFGRITSSLLRSAYSPILGLGGWLLAALIVLVTMPTVRVDNEFVTVVAVGVAVGFTVFAAWLHRDWAPRVKAVGFAAAVIGGFIGAWIGFGAVESLLGPFTAIVGSIAIANLALIVFDVLRTRPIDLRTPARETQPAGAAHRQTGDRLEPRSSPTPQRT